MALSVDAVQVSYNSIRQSLMRSWRGGAYLRSRFFPEEDCAGHSDRPQEASEEDELAASVVGLSDELH